jgi:hypothetical protein
LLKEAVRIYLEAKKEKPEEIGGMVRKSNLMNVRVNLIPTFDKTPNDESYKCANDYDTNE